MGHSLGLDHDGPGCRATVMTGDPCTSLANFNNVSPFNCKAVERFKQEKISRDTGDGDGGGVGGGLNPGRGTDPVSRCTANPDDCEEAEEPRTCEYTWDQENAVLTVTCSC